MQVFCLESSRIIDNCLNYPSGQPLFSLPPKVTIFILCALASSLSISFCSHSTLSTPARAALVEASLGTHVAVMPMVCRISADLSIYFLMEISQDLSIHFVFFDCQ